MKYRGSQQRNTWLCKVCNKRFTCPEDPKSVPVYQAYHFYEEHPELIKKKPSES